MSEIKLPDLPPHDNTLAHDVGCPVYRALDMMCFAKDAVELDRQGRGEPVAVVKVREYYDYSIGANCSVKEKYIKELVDLGKLKKGTKLYTAPQPADPTIKKSLTVAEPVDEEMGIYEDVYDQITDMIEPYVQREYINPNGTLPASVVGATQMMLEHWIKKPAQPACVSPMSDKPACGAQNAECERQQPDPAMAGDDRAEFEAAYIDHGGLRLEDYELDYEPITNRYLDDNEQSAWWAWQASSKRVQPASKEDAK